MNSTCQRRAVLRATLFIGAAALVISPLLGGAAHAVTITGSTYASETGGPTPNPTSASYNLTNLTSVSDSIRSSVTNAYAESYASAMVTQSGVTKTAGGLGWTNTATTLYNARSDLWNASATGTTIEANYTGNGTVPSVAPFQFSLPASILETADPYYSNGGAASGDPPSMMPPVSGGMVAQGVNGDGIGQGSPTNPQPPVIVSVVATAYNGIEGSSHVTGTSLFDGSYEFDPTTGDYTLTGSFQNAANQFLLNGGASGGTNTTNPLMPEYTLGFNGSILGATFDAPVNTPFSVDIETSVMMGDPSDPTDFDSTGLSGQFGQIGAGGSVTAQFLLTDTSDFSVSAVPEPSSLWLAAFAAAGLILVCRRRRLLGCAGQTGY